MGNKETSPLLIKNNGSVIDPLLQREIKRCEGVDIVEELSGPEAKRDLF